MRAVSSQVSGDCCCCWLHSYAVAVDFKKNSLCNRQSAKWCNIALSREHEQGSASSLPCLSEKYAQVKAALSGSLPATSPPDLHASSNIIVALIFVSENILCWLKSREWFWLATKNSKNVWFNLIRRMKTPGTQFLCVFQFCFIYLLPSPSQQQQLPTTFELANRSCLPAIYRFILARCKGTRKTWKKKHQPSHVLLNLQRYVIMSLLLLLSMPVNIAPLCECTKSSLVICALSCDRMVATGSDWHRDSSEPQSKAQLQQSKPEQHYASERIGDRGGCTQRHDCPASLHS